MVYSKKDFARIDKVEPGVGKPGPFGTHSMRKTGFVLAIWGKGTTQISEKLLD
jgi:hypothetical protein